MLNNILEVKNVSKEQTTGFKLKNINININVNQKIGLAGESGSGKSTLLKAIAGLIQTNEGEIWLEEKKILGPLDKLIPGYDEIAYLSQQHELLNNYKVKDLVWFENKMTIEEAEQLFLICDIYHLLERKTNELSGGEKQRIALCKLLIKKPKLLILDEPFSNIDFIHKNILKKVLDDVYKNLKLTIILTSHEPSDLLSWADEIVVLKNGIIVERNNPNSIYYQCKNEYVAGLFGQYNKLNSSQVEILLDEKNTVFNKSYLVRPEKIELKKDGNFEITKIEFNGFFHKVYVQFEGIILMAYHHNLLFKVGDKVSIKMNKEDLILIDDE